MNKLGISFVLCTLIGTSAVAANAAANTAAESKITQILDRIGQRERNEVALIHLYKPIVETYIQQLKPDAKMGLVPVLDEYHLGQADFRDGITLHSVLPSEWLKSWAGNLRILSQRGDWNPTGFLQMVFVDTGGLTRDRYEFNYIGREFLGDVRCLVFDVTPRMNETNYGFLGRVWVEDQSYTVVRFNGVFVQKKVWFRSSAGYLHFDSWRCNIQPDVWLPCHIFSEETSGKLPGPYRGIRLKAQTNLWGYNLGNIQTEQEFSDLSVEPSQKVQDDATTQHDRSPLQYERQWRLEVENNVIDTLQKDGYVAPPGPVDKVLDTVVNNLEVTNNLDVEPEIHCRVLLTSTLEMFSVGHTIVLSRGLLDVLPDEPTLAAIIAEEIGTALVPKPVTDVYGFNDIDSLSPLAALKSLDFRDDNVGVQKASDKALILLRNSPYKTKLGDAGLFLEQLHSQSKALSALISPNLGNSVYLASQLLTAAPALMPDKLDQIAALPIGSRIVLDSWDDSLRMSTAKAVPLLSEREKLPFEITPYMPYLMRYQHPTEADSQNAVAAKDAQAQTTAEHQ